jgi:biopolymer transport protein ExbB/TolQ
MYYINAGGPAMWPLIIIGIAVLVIAAKKGNDLYFKDGLTNAQLEKGINAIIFWGAFSVVLGLFAHFMGVYQAMQAISQAPAISPAIVAGGYAVSLITILTGLIIFLISAVLWVVFRSRYKSLTLKSE